MGYPRTGQAGERGASDIMRTSIGALLFFASYGILMGVFPAELAARNLGPADIGVIVGFYAIGAVCFRVFALNAVDRAGAHKIARLAAIGAVLATLLASAAMTWLKAVLPVLAVAKFIHGASASAFLTSGYAYVAQAGIAEQRGRRIGIYGGIGIFGLLIPPPLGIWLWEAGSQPWIWFIPVALTLPTIVLLPGDQRKAGQTETFDREGRSSILLFGFAVAVPILALATSAGMQGGFEAQFPLLVDDFEARYLMTYLYFLFGSLAVAGRIVGGWMVDHANSATIFFCSLVVQMFAIGVPLVVPTAIGLAASSASFGFGSGMLTTSAMALLSSAVPAHRSAAAIGLGGLVKDAGFALGAAITGLLIAAGGATVFLFTGIAAIASTAAIAAYGMARRKWQPDR